MKKIFIVLFLITIAAVLPGCSTGINYVYSNSNLYNVGEANFNLTEVNKIVIDWVLGEVEIKGEQTQTKVVITEDLDANTEEKYQMHYYLDNGVLTIRFMASLQRTNHKFLVKKLIVTLPEDFSKDLDINVISANTLITNINSPTKIKSVSGSVTIKNIYSLSYDINAVSGKINITDTSITDLKLTNVSGDIAFLRVGVANVIVDSVSGKVDLDLLNQPIKCDIDTVSGNMIISLPSEASFKFTYHRVNGEINSEFSVTIQNSLYIVSAGGDTYHFKTVSGSLNLKKR